MEYMKLDDSTWDPRNAGSRLDSDNDGLRSALVGSNMQIKKINKIIAGLYHMSGIEYSDQAIPINDAMTSLTALAAYVTNLPDDLSTRLDQPLWQTVVNGATQSISEIDANAITTPNTPGLTILENTTVNGVTYPSPTTKGTISFDDFTGTDPDGPSMPEWLGVNPGNTAVPGFPSIFAQEYAEWKAANPDQKLSYDEWVKNLIPSGNSDHVPDHPVKSFFSTVVSSIPVVDLVYAVINACAGRDVITGEQLSDVAAGLGIVLSVTDLASLILALPTGGASVVGDEVLDEAAKAVLRKAALDELVKELAKGAAQGAGTGVLLQTARALGLPDKAVTMISMGIGTYMTVDGLTCTLFEGSKEIWSGPISTSGS
jgi:hypothetical protein